jgi:hypothetical protein
MRERQRQALGKIVFGTMSLHGRPLPRQAQAFARTAFFTVLAAGDLLSRNCGDLAEMAFRPTRFKGRAKIFFRC